MKLQSDRATIKCQQLTEDREELSELLGIRLTGYSGSAHMPVDNTDKHSIIIIFVQ